MKYVVVTSIKIKISETLVLTVHQSENTYFLNSKFSFIK